MKTTESLWDALSSSCWSSYSLWPACPSVWQTQSWGKVSSRHCVIHGFHSSLSLEPGTLGRHGSRADTCYWLLSLQPSVSVSLRWTMQSDSFSSSWWVCLRERAPRLPQSYSALLYLRGRSRTLHIDDSCASLDRNHLPPGNAEFVSSHEGHQGSSLQKDLLGKNDKSAGHQAYYRDDSANLVHRREEGPKSPWGSGGEHK